MRKTLMLNIEGHNTPYAFMVPEQVYSKFAHYERNRYCHPDLIKQIEAACRVHEKRFNILIQQISDWKLKTQKEIEMVERKQTAQSLAKDIFI